MVYIILFRFRGVFFHSKYRYRLHQCRNESLAYRYQSNCACANLIKSIAGSGFDQ